MVIDFICIITALFLIVLAFLFNRKPAPHEEHDYGQDHFPGVVHTSAHHKGPEFEYADLNQSTTLIDEQNLDTGLPDTLREKVKSLTPKTPAGLRLLKFIKVPETKGEQIAAVVTTSPVFSIHVLRLVNSGHFNLPSKVSSVGTAILVMGYHQFKKRVMDYNLEDFLSRHPDDVELKAYNDLWFHSAMVSTCAAYLGQHVFRRYEQEVGTIGLLHDVGKYYLPLLEKKSPEIEPVSTCIEEDAAYGFNHALISSYVAEDCNLSDTIVNAIRYHHFPQFYPPEKIPLNYRLPSFICCLADLICKTYGYHGKGEQIYPIREEYFEMYDIDLKSIYSRKLEKALNRCRVTMESFMKY